MASLSVVISAETADLHAKLALAQADLRAFNAETKAAAESMRTAGASASGELRAGLEKAAAASAGAHVQVAGLRAAVAESTVSQIAASGAMKEGAEAANVFAHSTTRAKTELIVLANEMFQGRFTRIPGSIMVMSEGMRGLGTSMLGAVGGVAAVAGALAYLAITGAKAANALASIQIGAEFAGNLDITKAAIEGLSDQLESVGLSSKDANTVIGTFARMVGMTSPQVRALSAVVTDYATAVDTSADKAAESLAKMFAASESASKIAESLGGMTPALKEEAAQADASGNATAIFTAKMDALDAALARARGSIDKQGASITNTVGAYLGYLTAATQGISADQYATIASDAQTDARKRLTAAYKESTAAIADSAAHTITAPPLASMKATAPTGDAARARDAVTYWTQELATAEQYGGDVKGVMKELDAARLESAKVAEEAAKKEAEAAKQASEKATQAANEETRARQEAFRGVERMVAQDRAVAAEDAQYQIALSHQQLDAKKSALQAEVAAHQVSHAQEIAQLRQFATQEEALDEQALQASLGAATTDAAQRERINNQILLDRAKLNTQLAALDRQLAAANAEQTKKMAEDFKQAFEPITRAWDQMINGVMQGTQSMQQVMARAFSNMAISFIEAITKMLAQWALFEAATALGGGGPGGIASAIGNPFGAGAAGLGGLIGGLFGGGAAASPAAMLAGGLIAMDSGAWNIPAPTAALLHPGEMVLPAAPAADYRSGMAGVSGGSGGASGGGSASISVSAQMINGRDFQQLINNPTFLRPLIQAIQAGLARNPSLQGAY